MIVLTVESDIRILISTSSNSFYNLLATDAPRLHSGTTYNKKKKKLTLIVQFCKAIVFVGIA